MLKPWHWKLQETNGGPDHFLFVWFEVGEESLREVFARNVPPGYVPDPNPERKDIYCDERTAQKVEESKTTNISTNIWCYDYLSVEDFKITAETGFGCGTCTGALTDYIVQLLNKYPIQKWMVTGGGQGYSSVTVAEGEGNESFLKYLRLQPLPSILPDFDAFHSAVMELLEQSPCRNVFRLGEFSAKTRMCKFTLLLVEDVTAEVKRSGTHRNFRGWQPHTDEANAFGRALIETCHIPGKMGRALADPTDLILCDDGESVARPTGFELLFGFWNETDYDAPNEIAFQTQKAQIEAI